MIPVWRRPASRKSREGAVLAVIAVAMFALALIGNSMTRPLDAWLDIGSRDAETVSVVTKHVSR
jgi:hypothetical protein